MVVVHVMVWCSEVCRVRWVARGARLRSGVVGNDGLCSWGEAEEASVRAPSADVCVHQVEEVPRIGMELLARDGLSPFLVVFVAAEAGAFVL